MKTNQMMAMMRSEEGVRVVFSSFKSKDLSRKHFDFNFGWQPFRPLYSFLLMFYLLVSTSLQPLGFKYLMDHDPLVHFG